MTSRTRLMAGACMALALHASGPQTVSAVIGAMLPDADTDRSVFGKYTWMLSYIEFAAIAAG